jgi:hypothetical protein
MRVIDPGDGPCQGRFLPQTDGKSGGHGGSLEANPATRTAGDRTFTPAA